MKLPKDITTSAEDFEPSTELNSCDDGFEKSFNENVLFKVKYEEFTLIRNYKVNMKRGSSNLNSRFNSSKKSCLLT